MTSDHSSNGSGRHNPSAGTSATDTSPIRSLVSRTRVLLRSTWVITGLLASFGLGLLLVVVLSLTDFVVSSAAPSEWTTLRALALVLLVVPTTWAVIVGVLRPLFRRLSNVLVARRIETQLPKIHNRLVTCIDLEDESRAVPISEAFHRRLISEALERIRGFNPRKVLDIHSLQRAGAVATIGVLGLAVVFIPGVTTAMARVFNPFADIPPAGHVAYSVAVGNRDQVKEGDGAVVRGDDVVFLATLSDDRSLYEDERLQLTIETQNDEGEPVLLRHTLPPFKQAGDQRISKLTLKGLEYEFRYRVSGGGTYTKRFRVRMLARPEIVGVSTRLSYPEYMEKPERSSPVADVEGPIGSKVFVDVIAEGDIQEGKVEFLELKRVQQNVADRTPRTWFGATRPEGSAASGTWQLESLAGKDAHTDPANAAVHSHGFTKAAEPFQVGTSDVLFAEVYLPPNQQPREIMLKWHDGQGWEHRAFWGEDLVGEGKAGTASRFRVGDLPESGQRVVLEVPAAAVGLAGRTISGMMFTLHGGQAVWGASGTMPPAQETVVKLVPTGREESLELVPETEIPETSEVKDGQRLFTGTFSLMENGLYRVQLKNEADRYNKTMAEAKIVAIPDNPPQVIIERPRQTLVLTQPRPVPVFITSFDDFGVKEVVLSVKTADQDAFVGEPIVTLSPPLQNDRREVTLDLADRGLKTGDTLTYRVEVRDGKGQSGQTIDYVIQIKNDNSAADKQFEQLEKQTDTFRDKLVDLISKQKKIQAKSNELEQDYKELTEKIEKAKEEADKEKQEQAKKDAEDKTKKKDDPKAKPEEDKPVELDAEEQKKLAELKKELAKLLAEENNNAKLSEQVKNDLGALAKQAEENPLVPPQVAEQMKQLEQAFEKAAVDPLKQIAEDLQKATQPKQQDTKLPELNKKADRVQKDLEAIQKRMDALARAQRDSRDDMKQAMQDLKKDLLEQTAELARDALEDLKEYLKAMQKDLEALKGKEENLLKSSLQDLSSKELLDALKDLQEDTAKKSDKKLDKTAELLNSKRQPDFPDRPYKPEDKDYKIPPKEQDTQEGDPTKENEDAKKDGEKKKGEKKKGDEEAEEEFFLPALGGLRAELDPRFEKMIRDLKEKLKKQQENGKEAADPEQQERNRQQLQRLEELDMAQRALKTDQKSLKDLQDQLQQAQQKSEQGEQQQQKPQQKSLEQTLEQALMQQARKMMQRMQKQQNQPQQQPGDPKNQPPQDQQKNEPMPPQPTLANQLIGNQDPDGQEAEQVLVDLSKLDVATRRVIMKMQPKEREELLQGLREEGPKAYRGFIRDYFKKLSRARTKGPKK